MQKQIVCLIIILLSTPPWLGAQQCIDTVQVKGYYITEKLISELKTNGTYYDKHQVSYFIPADSISSQHPLSYWLHHTVSLNTQQLFMSCESIELRYLLPKQCRQAIDSLGDTCTFPVLSSTRLYHTPAYSSRVVYEIAYLDAWWAKTTIDKKTIQSTFVSSRLLIPDAPVYNLYYFLRCNQAISNPEINDACIVPFPANSSH